MSVTPELDPAPAVADLDTIVSLAKRRGVVYPSSEIYGGINAVWDYGPLGVELKNNVKRAWWRAMVQERNDIVGLDAGILMHPRSGSRQGTSARSATPWSSARRTIAASAWTSCPARRTSPRPTFRTRRWSSGSA